jgi:hypothetical protein
LIDPIEKLLCNKPPINGYEDVLNGNESVPDVAYQINQTLIDNRLNEEYVCINAAIEESTLYQRFTDKTNYSGNVKLLPQDEFIYDNIQIDDILIVSVGGNDIALSPKPETKRHFENFIINTRLPDDKKSKDDIMKYNQYFNEIFKNKLKLYIEKLCSRDGNNSLPSLIIPCMVYYPCLSLTQVGFAEPILSLTGYKTGNHEILQNFIKELYLDSTRYISIMKKQKGMSDENKINIIDPCPLYEVLDSSNEELYLKSAEPSIKGGYLMAIRFVNQIKIHKYIRSYFLNMGSGDDAYSYSMGYFRGEFLPLIKPYHRYDKYKILVNELLLESNKLNHSKKDKYYHNELKKYINIIFKDSTNIDDIRLFIMNQVPDLVQ